jgi:hypothetical protein
MSQEKTDQATFTKAKCLSFPNGGTYKRAMQPLAISNIPKDKKLVKNILIKKRAAGTRNASRVNTKHKQAQKKSNC